MLTSDDPHVRNFRQYAVRDRSLNGNYSVERQRDCHRRINAQVLFWTFFWVSMMLFDMLLTHT